MSDPLRCGTLHPGVGLGFPKLFSFNFLSFIHLSGLEMEEPRSSSSSSSSPSSSTDAVIHRDTSGAATSSSSTSQVREEEDDHNQYHQHHNFRHPELDVNEIGTSYRVNLAGFDERASVIRDDTWSCIIVLLTFWFFGLYLIFYLFLNIMVIFRLLVI